MRRQTGRLATDWFKIEGKVKFCIWLEMHGGVWWLKSLNALRTCTYQVQHG